MGPGITRRAAALAALAAGWEGRASAATSPPTPRRVVSIGQCLDVILMEVADRGQIAAITHYSRDASASTVAEAARALPFTYESAEEVLALRPDLVVASRLSGLQTRMALKRLGVAVEEFETPDSIAASLAQIRRLARLVGHAERGEAAVALVDRALAAAAPAAGQPRPTAAIYEANGFTAGRHTLIGEMMERCGLDNVASRYGVTTWGNISLERLIADPPQILLAGEVSPGAPTWADRVLRHPALARLRPRLRRASFPQRLLYCGGPVLAQTAAALAIARQAALSPA